MKILSILMLLLSVNIFAATGTVSRTLDNDLVQTLWQNGASLLNPADALFQDTISDPNSPLVKEIKRIFEENVEPYAQPTFPNDFRQFSLKSNAIVTAEGNSSMEFGSSYIVPVHGAIAPKMDALIAWIIIDINGKIDGPTTINISVTEASL